MNLTWSQKERLYLEDLKSHEQMCVSKYSLYANQAQCEQLKQILKANEMVERSHLDSINQLLSGTLPNTSQSGQDPQQKYQEFMSTTQVSGTLSDKDICTDLLNTEKYVSSTYDTAIFEFQNTNVRDVLNHIQKEEQKHGEAIFQYMQSKGLYNVK
ncbi:MAG: spore coat protein [Clostridiales bacterium]|jgi:spore coat protein CotF|nr:spore coat protein [Clostridiales bacterium]